MDEQSADKKPSARVAALDLGFGQALTRRNGDLLGLEPAPDPAIQAAAQKSLLSLFPQAAKLLTQRMAKAAPPSQEYAATSSKPVELPAPVPLDALERVIRECPELSRAIAAITVGVASRGFALPVIDAERAAANEADAAAEHADLLAWIQRMCPNRSFSQVMKITVSSRKRFGFAAWEILRNIAGQVVGINPIEDGKTLRWCELDAQHTVVTRQIPIGDRIETESIQRRFRRFKQVISPSRFGAARKTIYFKEFMDPRPLNRVTGEYWTAASPPPAEFPYATELLLFPVVDAGGEHPQPEWIPILPDALASRAIRIINLDTLNNGATPPFIVVIEGTVDDAELAKIMDQFKDIQGETSRRRAIFVQVDSTTVGAGANKEGLTPKVRIEPMAQLMTTEGMFLKYLMWLEKSIASALRLPLLLVGNIDSTLNRATAEAALVFAEDQVFAPERQDIEDVINDQLLPEYVGFSKRAANIKGVKYHRFALAGYSADRTADYLKLLAYEKGALSLNEKRAIIDTLLPDQKIDALDEAAANRPAALLAPAGGLPAQPGLELLPEDSPITQALKAEISKHHCQGRPVARLYYYEQEAA